MIEVNNAKDFIYSNVDVKSDDIIIVMDKEMAKKFSDFLDVNLFTHYPLLEITDGSLGDFFDILSIKLKDALN